MFYFPVDIEIQNHLFSFSSEEVQSDVDALAELGSLSQCTQKPVKSTFDLTRLIDANLVQTATDGKFFLTSWGVLESRRVRFGESLTGAWVHVNLNAPVKADEPNTTLYQYLSGRLAKKLPASSLNHLVGDHVQEFLIHLIERDSLANRIREHLPIHPSSLLVFLARSAYNDLRDMAQEPVCRQLIGAKTELEVQGNVKRKTHLCGDTSITVVNQKSESGDDSLPEMCVVAASPTDSIEAMEAFDMFWARLQPILENQMGEDRGRQALALSRKVVDGLSIREAGEEEGMDLKSATALYTKARSWMPYVYRDVYAS